MNPETQTLTDQVTETKGVMASAKLFIDGVANKLTIAADAEDWGAVKTLTADFKNSSDELAASIAANP